MSIANKFSEDELVIIFEAARAALADGDTFDRLAVDMDIADDEMVQVRDKLSVVMNEE
jgi:hypothetical protein